MIFIYIMIYLIGALHNNRSLETTSFVVDIKPEEEPLLMSNVSIVKQFKRRTTIIRLVVVLILIVVSAVLTYIRVPNEIKYFTATKNVFATSCDTYEEDQFYRGHLYFVYDWIAENADARFYLAPVNDDEGNEHFLIVYIPNKFAGEAERLMEQTRDYLENGEDAELSYDLNCRGKMYEVNQDTLEYAQQYFISRNAPSSAMDKLCDQMFVMIPLADAFSERLVFWIFIDFGVLITVIVLIFSLITKSYLKSLKKRLAQENMTLDDLDKEFENPLGVFDNNLVSANFVFEKTSPFRLMRIRDVLWIYPSKTRVNGGSAMYSAVFMMRNHGCFKFPTSSESTTEQLCRWVLKMQPKALYGYVIENSNMYYKNFNQLIDQIYNQNDATPVVQPVVTEQPVAPVPTLGPDSFTAPQQGLSPVLSAETLAQSNRTETNVEQQSNVLGTGDDSVRKE